MEVVNGGRQQEDHPASLISDAGWSSLFKTNGKVQRARRDEMDRSCRLAVL